MFVLIWLFSTKIFAKRQQHMKLLTLIQVILLKIQCKQNIVNITVSYMFLSDSKYTVYILHILISFYILLGAQKGTH